MLLDKGRVDRFRNRLISHNGLPQPGHRFWRPHFGMTAPSTSIRASRLCFGAGIIYTACRTVSRDARKEPIILVEGYMDALQLYQHSAWWFVWERL